MRRVKPASLFRRLLLGFMLVMLAIWLCALARIVHEADVDQRRNSAIVNQGWARQIALNMRSVAGRPQAMREVGTAIEALRQDMFRQLGFPSRARTRVWQGERLVYSSEPGPASPPGAQPAREADGWSIWVERDAASGITVERSERIDANWMFTASGAGYLLTPLVYSLPFLLLPAWFIVRVGLRPLRAIVAAIEQRSACDLVPLAASPYKELAPLVAAINSLMRRLSEQLEREQEFLTDAAHELKTPLSVIQINAHLLNSSADPQRRQEAGAGLRQGVARATHTVHQLLALERAGSDRAAGPLPLIELVAMVRDRLALAAPLAIQRAVDIELRTTLTCQLALHRESMAALLDNLISNAIKYSPDGGIVAVRLEVDGGAVRLRISDQGPGIAPALRLKVFERFYRAPGQDQDGSGLGLAIAERAAARNGAHIELRTGADGTGLTVVVSLPGQATRE